MNRDQPREIMSCRDCGAQFDLAKQNYYEDRCPSCIREDEPERTWPLCALCSEKVSPEDRTSVELGGTMLNPTKEYLPAHEDCADDHTPPGEVRP